MLRLKRLALQNILFFKKADYRFDQHALTFVTGRNLNANGSANAAGKSLFFSQIYDLIFGAPSVGVKRDSRTNGKVALAFSVEEDGVEVDYRAVRSVVKNKESLKVHSKVADKWVDKGFRELSEARKYLQSLIGFTVEEFGTLVYIDGRVPHKLITGDTAVRKNFFTRFFRLESQSNLRAVVAAELKLVEKAKAEHGVYRSRYRELKKQLKDPVSVYQEEIDALTEDLDKTRNLMTVVRSLQEYKSGYDAIEPKLERATELCEGNLPALAWHVATRQGALERLEKEMDKANAAGEAVAEYKAARKKRKQVKAKLAEMGDRLSTAVVRAHLKSVTKEYHEFESLVTQSEQDLQALKKQPATCYACGQKMPRFDLGQHTSKVDEVREILWNAGKKKTELEAKTDKLRKKLEGMQKHNTQRASLVEELEELHAVEKPEGTSRDAQVMRDERKAINVELQLLLGVQPFLKQVKAYMKLTKSDHKILANADKLLGKYEELTTNLSETKALRDEQERVRKELKELRTKINDLSGKLEDEPALRLLGEVFGKRGGLEKAVINSICEALESQVNRYAPLIFPENFRFSFELESQFNILVHRIEGNHETVSDVRKLSGAESRMFNLVLLMALMAFVPASRRCNLLILDEPDANMGDDTRDNLMAFLPVLNTVIPHIVFITPQSHILDIATQAQLEAELITVVKKGKTSWLETRSK